MSEPAVGRAVGRDVARAVAHVAAGAADERPRPEPVAENVDPLWSGGASEAFPLEPTTPEGAAPLRSGSAFLAGDLSSGHDGLPAGAAAGELSGEQELGRGRGREQGQRAPSWRRSRTPFEVLADPVEVWIIEQLCVGEHSSGDLASLAHEALGIGWSAVSRHLVTLRRAGFTDVGARRGAPPLDEVHHRPARLRLGRGARDLARRGVGRSEWAEETDGGAGLT